jgi:hypothetical protein
MPSSPWVWAQEVPTVAFEIQEHRKSSVSLIAWRRDELHASGDHALVSRLEIVDAQEHSNAAGKLAADSAYLLLAVSTREQYGCLASMGTNHYPSLGAAIIRQRRRVFHQLELQYVNEEPDRRVVVPHHQRDEFNMRHRGPDYRELRAVLPLQSRSSRRKVPPKGPHAKQ